MQLIIHCGLDKAGSTAIQAHVALFRGWLMRKGVYVPSAGLSGFGHVSLFRDLGRQSWQPLLDELARIRGQGYRYCFLSYEGICSFERQSLLRIRDYLADYEVTVLFYLREQAQIVQSGYLQGLKSAPGDLSIAHLNSNHALLDSPNRDYLAMLDKFESIFGRDAIALRLYEPGNWRDGSIVWDLLDFMGCSPDAEFTASEQRQNSSLDAQSAAILNVFDSYGDNAAGREALVEDLLWMVQKYPGGSRYFLEQAAVQYIRSAYRSSNLALAARYGVEFDYRDCVADAAAGASGAVSYMMELARLGTYCRWQGEQLEGSTLGWLLRFSAGWSSFEPWGVWTLGDVSHLEFRLPLARFVGFESSFTLNFQGRYFGDNTATRLRVGGSVIGDFDLRQGAIKLPIGTLDADRVLRLELRHQAAVSPAELGVSSDGRRLAYGLQALSYQFSR